MRELPKKTLLLIGLLLSGSTAAADEVDDLDGLVATALERNPELDVLEAQVTALEQKVTQAGAWKDPKLTVAYQNVPWNSFALGDEPMSMLVFRIDQTVPFFGKTGKREGVVRQATKAKRWELLERKAQLRSLVKRAYYKLALARQLKRLTQEHVGLVEQLVAAVRIRYEVGNAAQQNLLRLEVLRDRLEDELEDFDREDHELTAAINSALHRGVETRIETPSTFDLAMPSVTIARLKELALKHRPQLKQLAATARMHRSAAQLARSEAMPDPTFFASYALRKELDTGNAGRDLVTLGVSMPLPLFYGSRYGAQAEESLAQAAAADSQQEAVVDAIAEGLADSLATLRRAARKVERYRNRLVPEAHRALDATFSSYQVDRADFLSLYEAELELLNFEKAIRVAAVQGLVAQTDIERLVGRELQ